MHSRITPDKASAASAQGDIETSGRPSGTAHARRVMLVEQAFTKLPGSAHGPSEIAAAAGLDTTVVFRILQSGLSSSTFVKVPPGRYRLGPGAARVGIHAMAATPGPQVTQPVLDRLSRVLDSFVILWVLSPYGGPRKAHAASAPGRYGFDALGLTVTQLVELGQSLRIGASGRVIAAHLPPAMAAAVFAEPLPAGAGPGAVRSAADFADSLQRVRESGYAVARGEILGWDSIAAPVLWGEAVYGAVTVLRPSSLMPRDLSLPLAATVAAAERLSRLVSGTEPTASLQGRPVQRAASGRTAA
ncbi:IclR family transcriptional regulator domain-containing protein [Streptomyces sp. 2.9]|uniref:IclR family transcriptional regulator domain-containing protein n=1 Tax=Streptomyces tritrimontium TaxID=3406573 RepID=UPI003BB546A4